MQPSIITPSDPASRRQQRIEVRRMRETAYRPLTGRTVKRCPFRHVVTALIPVAVTWDGHEHATRWARRVVAVLDN